jgi:hypothetical protein
MTALAPVVAVTTMAYFFSAVQLISWTVREDGLKLEALAADQRDSIRWVY